QLMAEEQFCGQCGTPRAGDYETSDMQRKGASLWQMQESQKKETGSEIAKSAFDKTGKKLDAPRPDSSLAHSLGEQNPELITSSDLELPEETDEPVIEPA